jgi:hypothetical protein
MTETRTTVTVSLVAITLAILAWVITPGRRTLSDVANRGQPFFEEFTDPNSATSLEVITYDEETSVARPFKVQNRDGRWTIPSVHNYPADGGDRLATLAGTLIALKKDDIASDLPADHERCHVLDPLDETLPTAKGRGTRIIVKGVNDRTLADVIIGGAVDGRPTYRYVRLPGTPRTYVARIDKLEVSTTFQDWIEKNLLQLNRSEIDQIIIRNYSTQTAQEPVGVSDVIVLRNRSEDVWTADAAGGPQPTDTFKMNLLVTKLVELSIQGVRPKPLTMVATLLASPAAARVSRADLVDLASKGFFFSDQGQPLAKEGEVLVHTKSGVFYVLRFGNLVEDSLAERDAATPGRYLFISVGLDTRESQGQPPKDALERQNLLRTRFAPWYYVVSEDSFKKIRLTRAELVRPPKSSPSL